MKNSCCCEKPRVLAPETWRCQRCGKTLPGQEEPTPPLLEFG